MLPQLADSKVGTETLQDRTNTNSHASSNTFLKLKESSRLQKKSRQSISQGELITGGVAMRMKQYPSNYPVQKQINKKTTMIPPILPYLDSFMKHEKPSSQAERFFKKAEETVDPRHSYSFKNKFPIKHSTVISPTSKHFFQEILTCKKQNMKVSTDNLSGNILIFLPYEGQDRFQIQALRSKKLMQIHQRINILQAEAEQDMLAKTQHNTYNKNIHLQDDHDQHQQPFEFMTQTDQQQMDQQQNTETDVETIQAPRGTLESFLMVPSINQVVGSSSRINLASSKSNMNGNTNNNSSSHNQPSISDMVRQQNDANQSQQQKRDSDTFKQREDSEDLFQSRDSESIKQRNHLSRATNSQGISQVQSKEQISRDQGKSEQSRDSVFSKQRNSESIKQMYNNNMENSNNHSKGDGDDSRFQSSFKPSLLGHNSVQDAALHNVKEQFSMVYDSYSKSIASAFISRESEEPALRKRKNNKKPLHLGVTNSLPKTGKPASETEHRMRIFNKEHKPSPIEICLPSFPVKRDVSELASAVYMEGYKPLKISNKMEVEDSIIPRYLKENIERDIKDYEKQNNKNDHFKNAMQTGGNHDSNAMQLQLQAENIAKHIKLLSAENNHNQHQNNNMMMNTGKFSELNQGFMRSSMSTSQENTDTLQISKSNLLGQIGDATPVGRRAGGEGIEGINQ